MAFKYISICVLLLWLPGWLVTAQPTIDIYQWRREAKCITEEGDIMTSLEFVLVELQRIRHVSKLWKRVAVETRSAMFHIKSELLQMKSNFYDMREDLVGIKDELLNGSFRNQLANILTSCCGEIKSQKVQTGDSLAEDRTADYAVDHGVTEEMKVATIQNDAGSEDASEGTTPSVSQLHVGPSVKGEKIQATGQAPTRVTAVHVDGTMQSINKLSTSDLGTQGMSAVSTIPINPTATSTLSTKDSITSSTQGQFKTARTSPGTQGHLETDITTETMKTSTVDNLDTTSPISASQNMHTQGTLQMDLLKTMSAETAMATENAIRLSMSSTSSGKSGLDRESSSATKANEEIMDSGDLLESRGAVDDKDESFKHAVDSSEILSDTTTIRQSVTAKDCRDVGLTSNASGKYIISPDKAGEPFHVYCQLLGGEAWTVFQRRLDGQVDFYRSWEAYKTGFGNLDGEFWLGNDKLHRITSQATYKLRIDMWDWEEGDSDLLGNYFYAESDFFRVDNESMSFRLHVPRDYYSYSGFGGSGLRVHSGEFMTFDRAPVHMRINCAKLFRCGWWFSTCVRNANLNGKFYNHGYDSLDNRTRAVDDIYWRNIPRSLRKVEMKLKRVS